MHPNVKRGHEAQWAKFFDPRTDLIYDTAFHEPDDLPTPREVAASIPSCAGWGTGMEDCALTGGFVLDGLLAAHRVSGEAEWAEKARLLFRGLVSLGTVHGVPGYVARGFAPPDCGAAGKNGGAPGATAGLAGHADLLRPVRGTAGQARRGTPQPAVYPNSSADQYTAYVFGIWGYARSPVASAGERATAARLLTEVAARVEAHGHDVPRIDGKPSIYGDTSTVEPGRACRILQFYKAAHDLSGDPHWRDCYMAMAEDEDGIRLRTHYGPEEWPLPRNLHAVIQSQAAFRLLYDSESDPAMRAAYKQALRAESLAVMHRIPLWREKLAQPAADALPPDWRPRFAAFHKTCPDYDPSRQDNVQKWHGFRHGDWTPPPPSPEALRRAQPAITWLRHQTEALGIVMLCDEPDLKQQAAVEGWPMLAETDWTRVAQAGVFEPFDLAYWRGVEAGVFSA